MVRKYIRKTERISWSDSAMRAAIEAVIKAGSSVKRASADYKVPHATLSRKIIQCRRNPVKQEELLANPKGMRAQRVFTEEQEALLCNYVKILQNQLLDLNSLDIRRLAYNFAERFSIPHRFKKDTEMAGDDWYRAFLKRNPHISVKKTDSSDSESAKSKKVNKFFDNLKSVITAHQLEASNIYSIDEAVVTCSVSADSNNVNSLNEQKLVTAVICFSASGTFVPLTLVLPCRKVCDYPQNQQMKETWTSFSSTGQMQLEIFVKWLNKFIEFSNASKVSPVLLLIDGYRSYLKNLEVLEITENNGVEIVCLPFNCSSKLQPIQHNFMKILSKAYAAEIQIWMHANSVESVTVDKVYHLFRDIFEKTSLMQNIPVDSFQDTGIWPMNKDLFEEFIFEKENKSNIIEYEYSSSDSPSYMAESYAATSAEVLYDVDKTTIENEAIIQENVNESFNTMKSEANGSFSDDKCPIPIPSEAKLTAVSIENLCNLINGKEKLYFYVSPYKLKLPS